MVWLRLPVEMAACARYYGVFTPRLATAALSGSWARSVHGSDFTAAEAKALWLPLCFPRVRASSSIVDVYHAYQIYGLK